MAAWWGSQPDDDGMSQKEEPDPPLSDCLLTVRFIHVCFHFHSFDGLLPPGLHLLL